MRGEGNHKIPGSFAPENMEKTGAERVKYSLACQHEDAISIKFVSYAQKCPTVLCTFAVALRKESVDRNTESINLSDIPPVALRKESVDRNLYYQDNMRTPPRVALRKESVDRNTLDSGFSRCARVALRKESVDRNNDTPRKDTNQPVALRKESVDRNALLRFQSFGFVVALRKESVDRNTINKSSIRHRSESLSARRAWIEIQ